MYLKNIKTGEVFAYSPFIAALPEMVPCNLDGSLPIEEIKEEVSSVPEEKPEPKAQRRTK